MISLKIRKRLRIHASNALNERIENQIGFDDPKTIPCDFKFVSLKIDCRSKPHYLAKTRNHDGIGLLNI